VARTTKGEQTKARIVEAALALFRERGYEATTMRAVAEAAGVSLGNAYYYYKSKEHLLVAYYERVHDEHVAAARPLLEKETDLEARILAVMTAKFAVIEPYWRFSGTLFRSAADPQSPLNPFHEKSAGPRDAGIEMFREALSGAKIKLPADIAAEVPRLLWIYSMGIVLFWIHDDSPGRARTHALMTRSTELVVRIVRLLANPLLRPLRKSALKMLADLRP
jgi:AcrR family transcriptional regulator